MRHDDRPRLSFFVYGTLRPGEANHDSLLRGRIESEVPAVLSGAALYDGPGYPYAFDDPDGGRVISRVVGELIEPLPELYDQVLADLDRLEEYVPGRVARGLRNPSVVMTYEPPSRPSHWCLKYPDRFLTIAATGR